VPQPVAKLTHVYLTDSLTHAQAQEEEDAKAEQTQDYDTVGESRCEVLE